MVKPDSEIVIQSVGAVANFANGKVTEVLLAEFVGASCDTASHATDGPPARSSVDETVDGHAHPGTVDGEHRAAEGRRCCDDEAATASDETATEQPASLVVYGDATWGWGDTLERLERLDATATIKAPQPTAPGGRFAFGVDLPVGTVACPGEQIAADRLRDDRRRTTKFGAARGTCPLRERYSTSPSGRTMTSRHGRRLTSVVRTAPARPSSLQGDYRASGPKVERRLARLRRRAGVRG